MASSERTDGVIGGGTALISVARAQECTQLASLSPAILATLIGAASRAIVAHCRREFVSQTITEVRDGDGTTSILLRHFPAISLSSVAILDDDGVSHSIAIDQFRLNLADGYLMFKPHADADYTYFPKGFQNLTIIYAAGYAEIPEDVQQACVIIVCAFLSDDRQDPRLVAERLGDYSYTRESAAAAVPSAAKALLALYRKVDNA